MKIKSPSSESSPPVTTAKTPGILPTHAAPVAAPSGTPNPTTQTADPTADTFVPPLSQVSRSLQGEAEKTSVWLDVDLGINLRRPIGGVPIPFLASDPDDALALSVAVHSPEVQIEGISTVCGNFNDVAVITDQTKRTVRQIGAEKLASKVFAGGSFDFETAKNCAAVEEMAKTLRNGPTTLVALGPLTNVAALISKYPELIDRIENVVTVTGLREDEHAKLGWATATDFNVQQDTAAYQKVFQSGVPLTLIPFELTSRVFLDGSDLDAIRNNPSAVSGGQWLADGCELWLSNWRLFFGESRGFMPFDALAVCYVAHPEWFTTAKAGATFSPEAGIRYSAADSNLGERQVNVCTGFQPGTEPVDLKNHIVARLGGNREGIEPRSKLGSWFRAVSAMFRGILDWLRGRL